MLDSEIEQHYRPENSVPDPVEKIEKLLRHQAEVTLYLLEQLDNERSGKLGVAGEVRKEPTEADYSGSESKDE